MRASPAVDQQCGYVPSTPNPLARAHSAQRPGVAVTRRLITSTNRMLHPNRPALFAGSIPPTCTSYIAGRHKHGWARRWVRVWQSVAHLAARNLTHFGLVPAVLEAHLHPVYLGYQQLRRDFHWLGRLLRFRHGG